MLLQLLDDAPLLQLVDLDHGVQQLEVVSRVRGELLERDADAAVIVTEWPELKQLASAETRAAMARPLIVDGRNVLDPEQVRAAMARPLIVDGRNLLDPAKVRAAGFAYEAIGRSSSPFGALPETPEPERQLEA